MIANFAVSSRDFALVQAQGQVQVQVQVQVVDGTFTSGFDGFAR